MINILIKTDTRYPVNRKIVRKAVEDTFFKNNLGDIDAEVSVSVVGRRKMHELSEKFLDEDSDHDVLAFALEEIGDTKSGFINPPDEVLRLGDVILCWPDILEIASSEDLMVDDEVYKLTCHGVEHLLGKHHG